MNEVEWERWAIGELEYAFQKGAVTIIHEVDFDYMAMTVLEYRGNIYTIWF